MLSENVPLLLDWSRWHTCKFNIGKFQLVYHTQNPAVYPPLPLQIGQHLVVPKKSAKYLGIIIDYQLWWHEHVEVVVAKGTAAVLAIE